MKSIVACLIVGILCLLCSVSGAENEVAEYERSGSCNFFQECLYKYHTAVYIFGEQDKEKLLFSTDVHWHCESSGLFDNQPANEYCFTLSNASITLSFDVNSSTSNDQDITAAILKGKLKGEFCYVQAESGKIVSIHYSPTADEEGINIKRAITSAFQANFDKQQEVEESDPGSTHISHYRYAKTSDKVVSFTRHFKQNDLLEVTGGISTEDLTVYTKTEKSTFIDKVLYKSHGTLKTKVFFKNDQKSETFNQEFDFSNKFQANGTYSLERIYCKQRSKRNFVFADLSSTESQKGSFKATVNSADVHEEEMNELRSIIPSIPKALEMLHNDPSNDELVRSLRRIVELETLYGTPSQHTPTINQLVYYYKQIQASDKPEDTEMRKIMYSLFSTDGTVLSQEILGSALRRNLNEEERDTLLDQLLLIKKPNLNLVEAVISSISSNNDRIILVLGTLARNNNFAIQKVVINELVQRLNAVLSSSDNEGVTTLIYALGNSKSKLALSPLLSTLQYDDIDIQISAIRGLASHLDQPAVQQAIITLLSSTDEDKILEEILKILIDGFENKILTSPNEELINATVNSAIKLQNPNLYELFVKYLERLKTDEFNIYLDLLKQQHNYGDIQHEHFGGMNSSTTRVKRGSDWDENNPEFEVVASYSQRKSDVDNYPNHQAYILGKKLGIKELNLAIGAGVFGGFFINSTTVLHKFYVKVAAEVNILGATVNVFDAELSSYTDGKYLHYKVYLKKGINVVKNVYEKKNLHIDKIIEHKNAIINGAIDTIINRTINTIINGANIIKRAADVNINENINATVNYTDNTVTNTTELGTIVNGMLDALVNKIKEGKVCGDREDPIVEKSKEIFKKEGSLYISVVTVNFFVKGELSTGITVRTCICLSPLPPTINGTVEGKLPFSLILSGGAAIPFLATQRVGIDVTATFTYYLKPVISVHGSMDLHRNASISLKPLNVTNSNSSNISINFTLASSFEVTDRNGNVGRLIPFKLKSDTNRIVNINKNITVLNPFKPSDININAMMILYVIPNIEFCAHLNHGWEASLEICPYIQFRFINWSWKCVKIGWNPKVIVVPLYKEWSKTEEYPLIKRYCTGPPLESCLSEE